ncbi:acyl carrier protein [Streptomyces sp. 7-21]|jgi:acyl carrier protein|uniref:acyl carrier protein n=1 Tax=Streptomyces sp. 7-21 TaxID=2802283 RepID=UPI00192029CE|nr:acyl carrier protein [Streptomyces sp. 7-21]MBL1068716.1 acyl carrier protein [Streptomyces sp. 7-21]
MANDDRPEGYEETLKRLKDFLEERFLPDGETGLTPTSPLLEWGILTSLSTTELISYIQDQYGVTIPPEHIVGANFKNLDAITRLVLSLHDGPVARA